MIPVILCWQWFTRKGLHHLIEAWGKANLSHSQLTLVCRSIDPQIRAAWSLPKGIHLCSAVSQPELEKLYQQADVFVLPSLVEGFGYVYLEALARGCFCLGTAIQDYLMWQIRPQPCWSLQPSLLNWHKH